MTPAEQHFVNVIATQRNAALDECAKIAAELFVTQQALAAEEARSKALELLWKGI